MLNMWCSKNTQAKFWDLCSFLTSAGGGVINLKFPRELLGFEKAFFENCITAASKVLSAHTWLCGRVEWFSTFFDFRKATHFCRSCIFLRVQFQKICNFGSERGKVFIFQKITGTIQIIIFCWKFAETFL